MVDQRDYKQSYGADENSVLHERIDHLRDEGYRGFTIKNDVAKWNRWEITAKNTSGVELKANGETQEEAYKQMIDMIDYNLDDTQ
ncbi:MAG: hypothetical protein WEA56_13330 [Balneolaceae bacterium]